MKSCQNCERAIGNLERAFDWKEFTVCAACFDELRKPSGSLASIVPSAVASTSEMICTNPNCGVSAVPELHAKGNGTVLILLLLIGVLPGVLYAIFCCGNGYYCPRCHAPLNPPTEIKQAIARARAGKAGKL